MSVIGRLDGQVEEVIIKPAGRRRAPGEADALENAPAPHATPRDSSREARPADRPDESPDKRGDDGELPVWLL